MLPEGITENTVPDSLKNQSHLAHAGVTNTTSSDSSAVNS